MKTCPIDQTEFDPHQRRLQITVHERKGPSTDVCSTACAYLLTQEED